MEIPLIMQIRQSGSIKYIQSLAILWHVKRCFIKKSCDAYSISADLCSKSCYVNSKSCDVCAKYCSVYSISCDVCSKYCDAYYIIL